MRKEVAFHYADVDAPVALAYSPFPFSELGYGWEWCNFVDFPNEPCQRS